jgi:hypothetical protein
MRRSRRRRGRSGRRRVGRQAPRRAVGGYRMGVGGGEPAGDVEPSAAVVGDDPAALSRVIGYVQPWRDGFFGFDLDTLVRGAVGQRQHDRVAHRGCLREVASVTAGGAGTLGFGCENDRPLPPSRWCRPRTCHRPGLRDTHAPRGRRRRRRSPFRPRPLGQTGAPALRRGPGLRQRPSAVGSLTGKPAPRPRTIPAAASRPVASGCGTTGSRDRGLGPGCSRQADCALGSASGGCVRMPARPARQQKARRAGRPANGASRQLLHRRGQRRNLAVRPTRGEFAGRRPLRRTSPSTSRRPTCSRRP